MVTCAMKCPKCKTAEMKPLVFEGIEIDRCVSCHGIWFDRDEQEAVSHNPDVIELDDIRNPPRAERFTFHFIDCPRCQVRMQHRVRDLRSHHVVYEYCPECGGSFLDKGELTELSQDEIELFGS